MTADVYRSPIYRNVDTLFTYNGVKERMEPTTTAPTSCNEAADQSAGAFEGIDEGRAKEELASTVTTAGRAF